jgi:hypothetical protein
MTLIEFYVYTIIFIGVVFLLVGGYLLFKHSTYFRAMPKAILLSSVVWALGFVIWGMILLITPELRSTFKYYLILTSCITSIYIVGSIVNLKLGDLLINFLNKGKKGKK